MGSGSWPELYTYIRWKTGVGGLVREQDLWDLEQLILITAA